MGVRVLGCSSFKLGNWVWDFSLLGPRFDCSRVWDSWGWGLPQTSVSKDAGATMWWASALSGIICSVKVWGHRDWDSRLKVCFELGFG